MNALMVMFVKRWNVDTLEKSQRSSKYRSETGSPRFETLSALQIGNKSLNPYLVQYIESFWISSLSYTMKKNVILIF